jgi:16S rRNA (guanine(966)-N(2))-methyltransferase RsmD
MRVIAGQYRRRQLRTLAGLKLRPTSDRLRETLFNVLAADDVPLENSTWFDLFAGSGAIGIEALSRGAAIVYFVESHRAAATIINQNLSGLGINTGFEVLARPAVEALRQLAARGLQCDFCFLDPPWADAAAYTGTFTMLATLPVLKATSIAIAEHDRRYDPGEAFAGAAGSLERFRKLAQGDAALSFYRLP